MSRSGIYDPEYGFIPDDDTEEIFMTNGDRLRQMSDEELAQEIAWLIVEAMKQLHPLAKWRASDKVLIEGTAGEMLDWLKQEADNGA